MELLSLSDVVTGTILSLGIICYASQLFYFIFKLVKKASAQSVMTVANAFFT